MRKISIALISFLLVSTMFIGCGNKNEITSKEEPQTKTTTTETKDETTLRTFIDQQGNEVLLPPADQIKRVVITSIWPLPSVYTLFKGSGEGLVGMHPSSKTAAEASLLIKVAPELKNVETNFIQGNEVNVEELMKLKPDVIFYRGENTQEYEILKKTGIPAVAFNTTSQAAGNTIETVSAWFEQLGEIFEKEDRADEIKKVGYNALKMIQEKVQTIPEDQKVRAIMLFKYGEDQLKVAGKGHFGDYWLHSTGAINAAGEEIKGAESVNMEQIYKWNPDKIYITNFSMKMPEDLYNNTIEGHDWQPVKAVQEKQVYKIPLGMYRWYPPSSDTPLMLTWLAQKNYPDLFKDIDMEKEVHTYYEKFYDVQLSPEEINFVFNPKREAAAGVK